MLPRNVQDINAERDGLRQRRRNTSGLDEDSPLRWKEEEEAVARASGGWKYHFLVSFAVSLLAPLFVLVIYPSPIEPLEIPRLPEPNELIGVMQPNNILHKADLLFQDELAGPESMVIDGDTIYTGTADGWVNKIKDGKIEKFVTFGAPPCGGTDNEVTCGRPLGMRMDKEGFLVVMDAYHGMYKVNTLTGEVETLVSKKATVQGRPMKFFNDLDIGPDGKIYFSDSSSKWHRNQFPNVLFEGSAAGRLMSYDQKTGAIDQLMEGLYFANGVQLTRDGRGVLVADTVSASIHRYDIQTGKSTVWMSNLPGTPDNIRYCAATGTYWVGMATIRQKGKFSVVDSLASRPWLRGHLAKILTVKSLPTLMSLFSQTDTKALAIEVNEEGEIVSSIQDSTGSKVTGVSQVNCAGSSGSQLYFGSYHATFLGRLNRT